MGFYARENLLGGNIFEGKTYAGVVQDKKPPGRLTADSVQSATADNVAVGKRGGGATATIPAVNRQKQPIREPVLIPHVTLISLKLL